VKDLFAEAMLMRYPRAMCGTALVPTIAFRIVAAGAFAR
jgi:hypothetical protein